MEVFNRKIDLYLPYNGIYLSFSYSFNKNTKFSNLTEYISSLYPNLEICPCYSFYCNNKFINDDDLIFNYYYYLGSNLNFQIYYKDNICKCSYDLKKNYKKSKIEIIKTMKNHKENEINDLNNKKKNFEKQINSLEKSLKNNENKINDLQNEKINYKIQINSLENTKKEKDNKINQLTLEKKKYEKKSKEEIDKLKEDKKILEIAVNGDFETLQHLKRFGIRGENLIPKENLFKIDPKTNQFIGINFQEFQKKDFLNFYDVIIDIKSIKDINKGWEIKMNQKGAENYNKYKKQKILKIGVIGNSNKGKSFILSKISKIDLPSGTSIRTEGLSVKYPNLEKFTNRNIALLDSAGLETPVLKNLNDNTENKKDLFKEKSREKIITELFLQNYIIHNSDILIVVVGILSYSEQKLLNKIKTEIQKKKIKKPLFIIHNLLTYTSVKQVEEYIKEYLLQSATFDLEKREDINTKINAEKQIYYFEKKSEPKIYHLIFANEGSEAGNKYNKHTLDFLEKSYATVTDLNPFDVIQSVKEKFIELSKEIIERTPKNQFTLKDFNDKAEDNTKFIKLKENQEIKLKKCLIDELGFSNLRANGFEPAYNYFKEKRENEELIIVRVEGPGNCSIKSSVDFSGEYTIIRLTGNKKKDKLPEKLEDNIHSEREFGDYSLDIYLKTEDYLIENKPPKISEKKGLITLEYKLMNKQTEENNCFNVKEEDEV